MVLRNRYLKQMIPAILDQLALDERRHQLALDDSDDVLVEPSNDEIIPF